MLEFNPNIFAFCMLPLIIFASAFNIERPNRLALYLQIRWVMGFAILGTLLCSTITGLLFHSLVSCSSGVRDFASGNTPEESGCWDIGHPEAQMFGALISAVDPVATLGTFASLGVDPRLDSLIYGESIVNDAVAIVLFKTWGSIDTEKAAAIIFAEASWGVAKLLLGSVFCGLLTDIITSLLFTRIAVKKKVLGKTAKGELRLCLRRVLPESIYFPSSAALPSCLADAAPLLLPLRPFSSASAFGSTSLAFPFARSRTQRREGTAGSH